ncbi:hypothetical protein WOC76_20175, partial [Methylocystis sp. IM3]|uniref:hypothetical protein n=1 Tax=Methylocystis sp. IM3 TaxID=3136722 RepID=UPI00311A7F2D
MEKAKPNPSGANQHTKGEVRSTNGTEPHTLYEMGISKKQSSNWQRRAAVLPAGRCLGWSWMDGSTTAKKASRPDGGMGRAIIP